MSLPTTLELAEAKARIASLEADKRRARENIDKLQDAMARLAESIEAQERCITSLDEKILLEREVIAPIRRLPFEVLGEIICHCAQDPNVTPALFCTLSSVSRAWHHATQNTPRAWSNININYSNGYSSDWPATTDKARHCFAKAGTCPKDVTVLALPVGHDHTILTAILALINGAASTIRSLHIDFYLDRLPVLPIHIEEWFREPMPLLRTFLFNDHLDNSDGRSNLVDLTRMPNLEAWSGNPHLCTFPAHVRQQLQGISFTPLFNRPPTFNGVVCHTNRSILETLNAAGILQRLVVLTIPKTSPTLDGGNVDGPTVRAEKLTSLVVNFTEGLDVLFKYFRTPALRQLCIHVTTPPAKKQAATCLEHLLATDAPPLVELYLDGISLSNVDLLSVLWRLPLLDTFVLSDAKASNAVMEALSVEHDASRQGRRSHPAGWICPRLARLSVWCLNSKNDKFRITRPAVETLVEARAAVTGVAPLRDVDHEGSALADMHLGRAAWRWKEPTYSGFGVYEWRSTSRIGMWWLKGVGRRDI
ncbi:hypothetical protein EXIGLDRAFT_730925 [Exidia glandulosa HHB12029]|uniref:F-box domain-containing protein n=1 Tax=Exidia glandulosa HHB12029 TaxID=1314781 RepID=A0A165PXY9_EXIGL|nr:hypothetical protein EXIGLDRAFT_730925 [Exidia glandulosa HHB12029]